MSTISPTVLRGIFTNLANFGGIDHKSCNHDLDCSHYCTGDWLSAASLTNMNVFPMIYPDTAVFFFPFLVCSKIMLPIIWICPHICV